MSGKTSPVALVTGATSGIGVEIARRLVRDGFCVVVTGRDAGRGAAVAQELAAPDGARVTFIRADLTDDGAAQALVEAAVSEFGRLDVLVNNAAIDHTDDLVETPASTVRHVFETNAIAPLTALQAAARQMRRQNAAGDGNGGAIINVTSRLAHIGVPTMAVYSAAKGAVRSLTTAAAVELAPDNIRVNAVAPGMTRTPLFDEWLAGQDDPAATEKRVGEEVPLGRVAESADVAAAVGYLASDGAGYITGTTIPVDGGYTAT
ncbi:MAG: SDR family NAD(P)-dependent oxidoreductase [Mycobacteriaceae bacterium]|uniref:SDR family NAD(P)-dependent oxidoreductase n=1 Tax=Corynebacterium sp. TaxID=1720 RepID=UPI003F9DD504